MLACPLILPEIAIGQTGFLTASLFGGALLLAKRHPILAGLLAGLLAVKPQLDLMLPLLLLATGNGRAMLAAGLTVLASTLLSAALFGPAAWPAFAAGVALNGDILAQGRLVPWTAMQSAYGLLRLLGVAHVPALAVQAALALAAAAGLVRSCRRLPHKLAAAVAVIATLLASPYLLVWDLTLLGVAMAFLARLARRTGPLPGEAAVLLALGASPLMFLGLGVPIGFPCIAALCLPVARRWHRGSFPTPCSIPAWSAPEP